MEPLLCRVKNIVKPTLKELKVRNLSELPLKICLQHKLINFFFLIYIVNFVFSVEPVVTILLVFAHLVFSYALDCNLNGSNFYKSPLIYKVF